MKHYTLAAATLALAGGLAAGCARDAYPHGNEGQPAQDAAAGAAALVQTATRWTDRVEVYAVYPPLVAGRSAGFALHLTDLRTFKPVTSGRISIEIVTGDGKTLAVRGGQPAAPGEYLLLVTVPAAGTYRWGVRLEHADATELVDFGPLVTHSDTAAATAAVPQPDALAVTYAKTEQWQHDFATEPAAERDLRSVVRAPAVVRAVAGGEAVVSAPAAGRFVGLVPAAGARVTEGQPLGQIEPRLDGLADVSTLEADVTARRLQVVEARNEMARADLLVAARAVPARRFETARHELDVARAELRAAEARLESRSETLAQGGSGAGRNAFVLRSPIAGTVAAVQATPGAGYEAGAPLFRIVRTDPVIVEAQVGEREAPLATGIEGVALEVAGRREPQPLGIRAVRHAGVIDPSTHALPVWVEVANPGSRLLVGQTATAILYTSGRTRAIAVPASAILTDAGRPVVLVQTGGERFERRAVQIGARDGDRVAVTAGLRSGDRLVTRGAYDVLLAAAIPSRAAEGHVH